MSNSPLVSYTKISPNKTENRNHKIDTITIHCVVGQCSVSTLGNIFSDPSKEASSNYGIGYDGKIGMYVEEKDRSWCSSNAENDNRAITIECASDTEEPYAINDAVYKSLINLCADICKRNGIKELKWKADKSLIGHPEEQNMTVHRWFANKSCPGDYIYNRLGKIAAEVNAKLRKSSNGSSTTKKETPSSANSNKSIEVPFLAKIEINNLNIRKGPGSNYATTGKFTGKGTFTIVEVRSGQGSSKGWGKLKSGAGWISLDYCKITSSSKTNKKKKTIDELAYEVIKGKWGNGDEREKKLTASGYDYNAVQKRVNELM